MSVVERAFEIAGEGKVRNIPALKTTLRGEGHPGMDVQTYLSGNAIRFQLLEIIQEHLPVSDVSKRKTG